MAVIECEKYGKLTPKRKGGLALGPENAWELFLHTGLPEAYTLFRQLKEEEGKREDTPHDRPLS